DGTTLLVDAGAVGSGIPETDPHPDASCSPGEWIARYIARHKPKSTAGLDYAMITHFHPDHMLGIADVDKQIPIRTLLDRGWPDYNYPAPFTDSLMANYRRFIEERRTSGMTVARFKAGALNQIRLNKPADFPEFEIRNLISNADVWTGAGETTRALFPPIAS